MEAKYVAVCNAICAVLCLLSIATSDGPKCLSGVLPPGMKEWQDGGVPMVKVRWTYGDVVSFIFCSDSLVKFLVCPDVQKFPNV